MYNQLPIQLHSSEDLSLPIEPPLTPLKSRRPNLSPIDTALATAFYKATISNPNPPPNDASAVVTSRGSAIDWSDTPPLTSTSTVESHSSLATPIDTSHPLFGSNAPSSSSATRWMDEDSPNQESSYFSYLPSVNHIDDGDTILDHLSHISISSAEGSTGSSFCSQHRYNPLLDTLLPATENQDPTPNPTPSKKNKPGGGKKSGRKKRSKGKGKGRVRTSPLQRHLNTAQPLNTNTFSNSLLQSPLLNGSAVFTSWAGSQQLAMMDVDSGTRTTPPATAYNNISFRSPRSPIRSESSDDDDMRSVVSFQWSETTGTTDLTEVDDRGMSLEQGRVALQETSNMQRTSPCRQFRNSRMQLDIPKTPEKLSCLCGRSFERQGNLERHVNMRVCTSRGLGVSYMG